jgi:hypothetical protein
VAALVEAERDSEEEVRAAATAALSKVASDTAAPADDGKEASSPGVSGGVPLWTLLGAGALLFLLIGWYLVKGRRRSTFATTPGNGSEQLLPQKD